MASPSDNLASAVHFQTYTSFASDIDLLADGPASSGDSPFGQKMCRWIRFGSTGDIVLVRNDGTSVTVTGCVVGELLPVQATQIASTGTTITECTVGW